MPSLSLRGLSDQTYEGLRQLAIRNHRSMQEQVRLLIEREVRYAQVGAVERARQWRSVLAAAADAMTPVFLLWRSTMVPA
jgi:plasmid stability protein